MKKSKDELVYQLLKENKDSYVSGEYIADKLSVSRAMIFNYIENLRKMGYTVEAKPNGGYKLIIPFDIYNSYEIYGNLTDIDDTLEVVYKDTVDSTNNMAKELKKSDNGRNYLVTANQQTGGRGRYDRSFYSEAGLGLYFSYAFKPQMSAAKISMLPIITAAAVCSALNDIGGGKITPQIKWPNDVLIGGKKICGILTEASVEAETGEIKYAVIGTGINISHDFEDFPQELRTIATSLKISSGEKYERKTVLLSIVKYLYEYSKHGNILDVYRKYLVTGREISANGVTGEIIGVEESGHLIIKNKENEVIKIESGEINFIS